MDNYFITRYFDWPAREPGRKAGRINRALRRLGLRLVPLAGTGVMTNVEQRMNILDDDSDPAVSDVYDQFPGVEAACDEFLADKPEQVSVLYAAGYAHGFFRKL